MPRFSLTTSPPAPISPYVIPGDPHSGVLPRISTEPPGAYGDGDKKVQAYCFRMCLTQVPENRVPFTKPAVYDPKEYELLLRIFAAGWRETFEKFDAIPNAKTDTNNHGLRFNPLKACVVPRPIGWLTTMNPAGVVNLAPFSFFNLLSYDPPFVMFSAGRHEIDGGSKDTVVNVELKQFRTEYITIDRYK